ncbi:phosphotransferase enzyme family protein [Chlamydiota bacterium]
MAGDLFFYQQHLHLHDAHFIRIDHEDAMVAVVYHITQPDGRQYILKICERINDYLREAYFLRHLAGKIPVPQIVEQVEPQEGAHGAILIEYLPGALLKIDQMTDSLAEELGAYLALIHMNRLTGYGDPIQERLNDHPQAYFTLKFEEGLEECKPLLPEDLIDRCRRYYESNLTLLDSVDGPCIVHRDFRPGNLIVLNGKLQGIIDWAGARASFAEEDLCSLVLGEWLNPFLAGYASIRPIPDYIRLTPFLGLNRAIATIGFTAKRGTWENRHSRIYQFNRQFLETFLAISS